MGQSAYQNSMPVSNHHSELLILESRARHVRAQLQLVTLRRSHPTREQLVREAAYHRAEARGFIAGHELEDWLTAEAEVDERMNGEGRAY